MDIWLFKDLQGLKFELQVLRTHDSYLHFSLFTKNYYCMFYNFQ